VGNESDIAQNALKDRFIALRCTNDYMNFPLKLFQTPVYITLLT